MFNTSDSAARAVRRARKALAHAVRQATDATTPRAKARHERRAANARRQLAWAARAFEDMAYQEA